MAKRSRPPKISTRTVKKKNIPSAVIGDAEIFNGDCIEVMRSLKPGSVDLTVTSPPYDDLRSYNGNNNEWGPHVWKEIIKQLYRLTKDGGVVVWIVGDATINGSETGTSFAQALHAKECGFLLHDTMIYQKRTIYPPSNRYYQNFEYMFVFSKGKPSTFNGIKRPIVWRKSPTAKYHERTKDDGVRIKVRNDKPAQNELLIGNVWNIMSVGSNASKDKEAFGHPAIFPEELAGRHVLSWSNEGDTVFDPFTGSATTAKMAITLKRKFVGSELDPGYFEIAKKRIKKTNKGLNSNIM